MNERIKELRKALGLTQQEFASRIGSVQNTITGYETGRRVPSNQVIALICKTFNVDEGWLRTGAGEMFQKKAKFDEIDALMQNILHDDSGFRQKLVSVLVRMTEDEWKMLERKVLELAAEFTGGESAAPARTDADNDQEAKTAAAAEAVEVFDQVYLEKKVEAESSASASDTGGGAGEKMA